MKTAYELLGVTPWHAANAPAELKAAWRQAARAAHPDREGGSADRMAELNVAYETLSDARRRVDYDRRVLPLTHGACAECAGLGAKRKQRSFTSVEMVPCAACRGRGYLPKRGPR